MTQSHSSPDAAAWVPTSGQVVSCRYQFARLNTFTLGIPTTRRFLITFDYWAQGQRYSDQFQSDMAIPQDTHISLSYNPLQPGQNSRSSSPTASPARSPLIAVGVAGSIILSLAWLLVLRSCSPS